MPLTTQQKDLLKDKLRELISRISSGAPSGQAAGVEIYQMVLNVNEPWLIDKVEAYRTEQIDRVNADIEGTNEGLAKLQQRLADLQGGT